MTHTVEDALRLAVDDLGGFQIVGAILRPEMDPILAGQWLSDCLRANKRDKLSLAQILLVLRRANEAGHHRGYHLFSKLAGYGRAEPISPESQLAELQKRAESAARAALEASQELTARMRAAGLKLDDEVSP